MYIIIVYVLVRRPEGSKRTTKYSANQSACGTPAHVITNLLYEDWAYLPLAV